MSASPFDSLSLSLKKKQNQKKPLVCVYRFVLGVNASYINRTVGWKHLTLLQHFEPLVHFPLSFHALRLSSQSCPALPHHVMFLIPLGFVSLASYGLEPRVLLSKVTGRFSTFQAPPARLLLCWVLAAPSQYGYCFCFLPEKQASHVHSRMAAAAPAPVQ